MRARDSSYTTQFVNGDSGNEFFLEKPRKFQYDEK